MRCRDISQETLVFVLETDSALRCAELMKNRRVGFLPVLDTDRHIVGVLTDRDVTLRIVAEGKPFTTPAREFMTSEVISVDPEAKITIAEETLTTSRKSRVPLVDKNSVCHGVISLSDIAQYESTKRAGEILKSVTRRETKREIPLDMM